MRLLTHLQYVSFASVRPHSSNEIDTRLMMRLGKEFIMFMLFIIRVICINLFSSFGCRLRLSQSYEESVSEGLCSRRVSFISLQSVAAFKIEWVRARRENFPRIERHSVNC